MDIETPWRILIGIATGSVVLWLWPIGLSDWLTHVTKTVSRSLHSD